jgi:hypothetical protein
LALLRHGLIARRPRPILVQFLDLASLPALRAEFRRLLHDVLANRQEDGLQAGRHPQLVPRLHHVTLAEPEEAASPTAARSRLRHK